MKISIIVILAMSALFLPFTAGAEEILFVSVEKDIPPNLYRENGQIKGIYADIIRDACKSLSVTPKFRRYPWKRCLNYVKEGKADAIFPPIRTEEREGFLFFPDEPIMVKKVSVFARNESEISVGKLDDLKGLVIGVNTGYSYGKEFDAYKGLKKDYSRNINMQVRKLMSRRMDVAVAVEMPFRYISEKMGIADKIKRIYVISESASYLAFSKTGGEKNRLRTEKFSQILKTLKKEGAVQKIIDKYLK